MAPTPNTRADRAPQGGYVYFIGPEALLFRSWEPHDPYCVKIGYSKFHPSRRLMELQASSPMGLELIAFIEGPPSLERAFHDTFAELRSHGEWFFCTLKLHHFMCYFANLPPRQRLVERPRLVTALYDAVFSDCVPHPSISERKYLASARPEYLEPWFPEVLEV
jgi:hypothetical protein